MIHSLLIEDYAHFRQTLIIIAVMWTAVAIAMACDLATGIRKARRRGEARTSVGLRKTVDKAIRYYAMMTIALLFDSIITFFFHLPAATFLFAAFIFVIEFKSIRESAEHKKIKNERDAVKELVQLLGELKKIKEELTH